MYLRIYYQIKKFVKVNDLFNACIISLKKCLHLSLSGNLREENATSNKLFFIQMYASSTDLDYTKKKKNRLHIIFIFIHEMMIDLTSSSFIAIKI